MNASWLYLLTTYCSSYHPVTDKNWDRAYKYQVSIELSSVIVLRLESKVTIEIDHPNKWVSYIQHHTLSCRILLNIPAALLWSLLFLYTVPAHLWINALVATELCRGSGGPPYPLNGFTGRSSWYKLSASIWALGKVEFSLLDTNFNGFLINIIGYFHIYQIIGWI